MCLIELCDRIMVMCNGEVTGILDSKGAIRKKLWNVNGRKKR
jgi:simple sugar transport system ATP-binding protein